MGVCFLIPIVALSYQWILGLIGLGAAVTVFNIAGSRERTPKARLVASLMVTAFAWVMFILFTGVVRQIA